MNWEVRKVFSLPAVTARFVSGQTSYSPTLEIAVDWDKAISEQSRSSLSPGAHQGDVVFNPNLQGAALFTRQLYVAGSLGVHVVLVLPNEQPDRQEQSADKPRLTVPLRRDFSLTKDGGALILPLYVTYSGPPNTLTVSGPFNLDEIEIHGREELLFKGRIKTECFQRTPPAHVEGPVDDEQRQSIRG